MNSWRATAREAWMAGSCASIASAIALLVAGKREPGRACAPVNAVSHWIWGDPALDRDEPSLRHTAVGYLIHHAASVFWAALHACAVRRAPKTPAVVAATASATAAVACFVDLKMTPERLTPGFERRVSRGSLASVYLCFAIGLAVGTVIAGTRR